MLSAGWVKRIAETQMIGGIINHKLRSIRNRRRRGIIQHIDGIRAGVDRLMQWARGYRNYVGLPDPIIILEGLILIIREDQGILRGIPTEKHRVRGEAFVP